MVSFTTFSRAFRISSIYNNLACLFFFFFGIDFMLGNMLKKIDNICSSFVISANSHNNNLC